MERPEYEIVTLDGSVVDTCNSIGCAKELKNYYKKLLGEKLEIRKK